MKIGSILEWKTVNGICRGIVTESENGELMVKVDDRTTFRLKDFLSRKIRIVLLQVHK